MKAIGSFDDLGQLTMTSKKFVVWTIRPVNIRSIDTVIQANSRYLGISYANNEGCGLKKKKDFI